MGKPQPHPCQFLIDRCVECGKELYMCHRAQVRHEFPAHGFLRQSCGTLTTAKVVMAFQVWEEGQRWGYRIKGHFCGKHIRKLLDDAGHQGFEEIAPAAPLVRAAEAPTVELAVAADD